MSASASASASGADVSGEWHQDELSELCSFIEEHQQWLDAVLETVGWSKERVSRGQPHLMQCPYNQHHFIDKSTVKKHKLKCHYGSVGVVPDNEETNTSTAFVNISSSIVEAVKKYAKNSGESSQVRVDPVKQRRDYIDQSDVVVESHDKVSSLESRAVTPKEILAQGPLHIIRYIKAWSLVPADFHTVSGATINHVELKAWLFTNLPSNHSFSSQLGGEIQAVEHIVEVLTGRGPSVTPDLIVTRLTPIFKQRCRLFVLRLWKFVHTAAVQKEHTILDSVVDDLAPLPSSAVEFLKEGKETSSDVTDSFAEIIQAIAAKEECPNSPLPPLPMETVPYILSPMERRFLYDYVVEVGGRVSGSQSQDPNLFRDDAAAIKAKLKQQARQEGEQSTSERDKGRGRETNLYQMKKERDYRRRRQKYRARNVHITRRTPAQVMHDIINARMLEISGGSLAIVEETSLHGEGTSERNVDVLKDDGVVSAFEVSSSERVEQCSRRASQDERTCKDVPTLKSSGRERSRRSRSRERSRRSRSRERLQRSRNRERSQRSRSRERSNNERSHRSRSRERSRKASNGERTQRKSRSTSRETRRAHSRKEKDRHSKKSRDREKKSSKKSEHT